MYFLETLFISIYLVLFFLNGSLFYHITVHNILVNIPVINKFVITLNFYLFMDWGMFSTSPEFVHKVKIIVETKDNLIDIWYLEDDFIKNNIPELNLLKSSFCGLIGNYTSYGFLNDFVTKKLNTVYNKNLKYISIYKITMKNKNFKAEETVKNSHTALIYQHTYGD